MQTVPILFTFDQSLEKAAGVCISSLLENASPDTFYDIFILHGPQCDFSRNRLNELPRRYGNCKLTFRTVKGEFVGGYEIRGIRFFEDMPGVRHNYSYFPIFVDAKEYGMTRDELYFKMKDAGVLGRRYFYPLISTFNTYRGLPSASMQNLPIATKLADEVICLPMHQGLGAEEVARVMKIII